MSNIYSSQQTSINIGEKSQMIWNNANHLVGLYKPHEYGKVILPMTVIKRFHDTLLPTRAAVLETYEKVKGFEVKEGFLQTAAGLQFYNISPYTFESLLADSEHIEDNFRTYLNGFSDNVQDILAHFEFDKEITKLANNNILFFTIQEFSKKASYLGADLITSIDMGYIFEDLIRTFSESYNAQAGAHFTARDIIYLMTDLLICDEKDSLLENGVVKTIYDQTMGTSQMLGCMEERLRALDADAEIRSFGQEFNPETFAIAKADMLIKGGNADNMRYGDTLSDDKFHGFTFDYCISNPPFGIDWKREEAAVKAEHKLGDKGRFGAGLPKISDGQMLFMQNGISKLKPTGRMAIIQNGSPLFSGDAGSGESEIRRYLIENDWLDAIIQLSTDTFYNTGITTYIWIVTKDKPSHREGKVQLIDASKMVEQRRKSIGNKRYDITDACRELIVAAYGEYQNKTYYLGDKAMESKIIENVEFGFNKITIESPYRVSYSTAPEYLSVIRNQYTMPDVLDDLRGEGEYDPIAFRIADALEASDHRKFYDVKEFEKYITSILAKSGLDANADIVAPLLCKTDDEAPIVKKKGKPVPDTKKRDTENVPLLDDIDVYFDREVRPYNPDGWIDRNKTKVGYEIPFTRYFYQYVAPEKSDDIAQRIYTLETEIADGLNRLFGKAGG